MVTRSLIVNKLLAIWTTVLLLGISAFLAASSYYWYNIREALSLVNFPDDDYESTASTMFAFSVIGASLCIITFLVWLSYLPSLLSSDAVVSEFQPKKPNYMSRYHPSAQSKMPPPRQPYPQQQQRQPVPSYQPRQAVPSYQPPLTYSTPSQQLTPDSVWASLGPYEKQIVAQGGCLPAHVVEKLRAAQDPCKAPARELEQCKIANSQSALPSLSLASSTSGYASQGGYAGGLANGFSNVDMNLGAGLSI